MSKRKDQRNKNTTSIKQAKEMSFPQHNHAQSKKYLGFSKAT